MGLSNVPHCSGTLALVVISIEPVSEPVVRVPAEGSLVLWVSEWTVSDQMIRGFTAMTPLWQWPIWTLGCDVITEITAIVTSTKKRKQQYYDILTSRYAPILDSNADQRRKFSPYFIYSLKTQNSQFHHVIMVMT